MTKRHESKRAARVAEPVQVYLARPDSARLARLAQQLDASKSDVLRRGLEALERQMSDPAEHPALRLIGIADGKPASPMPYDVAREHDRYLAESEIESWKPLRKVKKRGR